MARSCFEHYDSNSSECARCAGNSICEVYSNFSSSMGGVNYEEKNSSVQRKHYRNRNLMYIDAEIKRDVCKKLF